MIAVCIATYNHQTFIEQCVRSALEQVCDEPLCVYIGDDASTDKTDTVCRRLAAADKRVRFFRHSSNIGLVNNTLELYRQIMSDGCEYIAMLDGDDYWTDPNKLQLQINYLRSHPDVGFVHTGGRTLSGAGTWTFGQRKGVYGIESVGFANCTVVFRTDLLSAELLKDIEAQHFLWLDYPLYGVFYQRTQWTYLPQQTAVWRDHTSVSQPKTAEAVLRLREERVRMWKWLNDLFPGQVGYSDQEAQDYLFAQRLNLIYQFDDLTLATPELLNHYRPTSWRQKLKQKGVKDRKMYAFFKKISLLFAYIKK